MSHTKNCTACLGALANIRKLRSALLAVSVVMAIVALAPAATALAAAAPVSVLALVGWLAGCAAALATWAKLGQFQEGFFKGPYPPRRNALTKERQALIKARKEVGRGGGGLKPAV